MPVTLPHPDTNNAANPSLYAADRIIRFIAFVIAFCSGSTLILTNHFDTLLLEHTPLTESNATQLVFPASFALGTAAYILITQTLYRLANRPDQRSAEDRIKSMRQFHRLAAFLLWIGSEGIWKLILSNHEFHSAGTLNVLVTPIALFIAYLCLVTFHKHRIRKELAPDSLTTT